MADITTLSDAELQALPNASPPPISDLTDAELAQHRAALPSRPFSVLPLSEDPQGGIHFDIHAGIPGAFLDALTAPGDVYAGRLDPTSPEGQRRAFGLAATISPMNPAVTAGARSIPGPLFSSRRGTPPPPTAEELKTAASAGYDAARATGAEYPGADIGNLAQTAQHNLESDGIISELAPQTFAVLGRMSNPPQGSVATISGLDAARKVLNEIGGNFRNPTEQRAARAVINAIDQHIADAGARAGAVPAGAGSTLPVPAAASGAGAANGAGLSGVVENPLTKAARLIKEARDNAAASFRSDRLSGVEDAAEMRANAANSGQNLGNTLRQRLASLLLDPKRSRGFSEDELGAIRQVVDGTATSNITRRVSNLLGGGGGLGQTLVAGGGGLLGSAIGGGAGAAVGAGMATGLGSATRGAYNALVARQARMADDLVRQRSPLYQKRLGTAPMAPSMWDIGGGLSLRGMALSNPQGLLDAYSFPQR